MEIFVKAETQEPAPQDLAWTKRLLERLALPGFAQRLRQDPEAAGAELGMPWSPQRVRPLWDPEAASAEPDPLVSGWRSVIQRRLSLRDTLRREGALAHPAMQAWRDRQIQRCAGEMGQARSDSIVHAPFVVELSRGCSVGCWFCGLSAGRLEETWPYSPENASTWRALLAILREELGPGAKWGFCYWATEPLDNPDYERFLEDFQACLGVIPQTTTAAALRDPQRTLAVLHQARAGTPVVSRFSVLSPAQLERVHQAFRPEDLLEVELVLQFEGARTARSVAGRARTEQRERARREGLPVDREELAGSIACVSGFLVRPLEGTVQLVSPCRACERWPDGYIVFGERSFQDPEGFQRAQRELRDRFMVASVRDLPRVRPGRAWRIEPDQEGLVATSGLIAVHLRAPQRLGAVRALAELVAAGEHPAETLAMLLFYTCGQAEELTLADLELLFQRGVLDEEAHESLPG